MGRKIIHGEEKKKK